MVTIGPAEGQGDEGQRSSDSLTTAQRCVTLSRGAVFVTALMVKELEHFVDWRAHPASNALVCVAMIYIVATCALSLLRGEDRRLHLPLLVVDILLVTGVIISTGGIRNEYYLLYYIPIMQASVRLNFRDAVATAVLAAGLYSLIGLTTGPQLVVPVSGQIRALAFGVSALFMAVFFGLLGREVHDQIARTEVLTRLTQSLHTACTPPSGQDGVDPSAASDGLGASGPLAASLMAAEAAPGNMLAFAATALGADYGAMRLDDMPGKSVTWVNAAGAPNPAAVAAGLRVTEHLAEHAEALGDAVLVGDARAERELVHLAPTEGDASALAVALSLGGRRIGTLALYGKRPTPVAPSRQFDLGDLRMACVLAAQAGVLLDHARLHRSLYGILRRVVGTLAAALEARDPHTSGHSERVARYATFLARAMGLPEETIEAVELGALLHDMGKIGMEDSLLKSTAHVLDEKGWQGVWQHPRTGSDIFAHMPELSFLLSALRHHHERWDGRGYPDGLREKGIPLLARVIAIADAFDAMTHERRYREVPLGFHDACQELLNEAGTQFDPELARLFVRHATPDLVAKPTGGPGVGEAATGEVADKPRSLGAAAVSEPALATAIGST